MYHLEIDPTALKFLNRLKKSQPRLCDHVILAIDELTKFPHKGKKLMGGWQDFRSLRVGQYRVIYTVIEKYVLIQVVKIAHRREVYQ